MLPVGYVARRNRDVYSAALEHLARRESCSLEHVHFKPGHILLLRSSSRGPGRSTAGCRALAVQSPDSDNQLLDGRSLGRAQSAGFGGCARGCRIANSAQMMRAVSLTRYGPAVAKSAEITVRARG